MSPLSNNRPHHLSNKYTFASFMTRSQQNTKLALPPSPLATKRRPQQFPCLSHTTHLSVCVPWVKPSCYQEKCCNIPIHPPLASVIHPVSSASTLMGHMYALVTHNYPEQRIPPVLQRRSPSSALSSTQLGNRLCPVLADRYLVSVERYHRLLLLVPLSSLLRAVDEKVEHRSCR